MSHKKRPTRNNNASASFRKRLAAQHTMQHRTGRAKISALATITGIAFATVLMLGLALMLTIRHNNSTAVASGGGPTSNSYSSYGSLHHAKGPCGNTGQAPCAPVDPGWFSIASAAPADVSTAIARSENFLSMQRQFGYVSLDTPALVHAFAAHTGNSYYDDDHWVVSVRNTSGLRCGIFDFVYDRSQQRLRFSSFGVITVLDPHAKQAFPYIPSSVAIAQLQNQRKLGVMSGIQPELIFFPIDPSFPVLTSPIHNWAGGGNSALNPMWLIIGTDRQSYFVGTNLAVHIQKDLPIAKGQP